MSLIKSLVKTLLVASKVESTRAVIVCEAIIKEEVVKKVLKTNVAALGELNMLKNRTGSAMAGALGGFNAHASNVVSAVYIATGPDVMEEKCGSAAICFVAFLPDILDSKAEGRNKYLEMLLSIAEKFKRRWSLERGLRERCVRIM
ncbi:hypothetical protein LOK49_LG10G01323 [Camellia lanceoleosa]|uniref:Uncharacterized protein n=1 Tax=Camellia lanceoleosa TaxID=1840588 RepID=A0ACC0GFL3_9ERIC|nr:hypothetical protein LOK49_LG10G01323 [Camellia lanceoleosa]